jgi:hypothetical protein
MCLEEIATREMRTGGGSIGERGALYRGAWIGLLFCVFMVGGLPRIILSSYYFSRVLW